MVRRARALEPDDDLETIVVAAGDTEPRVLAPVAAPPPRQPWSRRRTAAVALGAVAIVVLGFTLGTKGGSRHHEPTTSPGPNPAVALDRIALLTPQRFAITTATGVTIIDPRHDRTTRLAGAGTSGDIITERNGDRLLVAGGGTLRVVNARNGTVVELPENSTIFAGLEPGVFWDASGPTVSLVGNAGEPSFRTPGGYNALAQIDDGFLVQNGPGGTLAVWDPHHEGAPRVLAAAANVVAVRHDRVAWLGPDCGLLRCNVHLTDVGTGRDAIIGVPVAATADGPSRGTARGRFSPDGRRLAMLVPDSAATAALVTFDVASGAERIAGNGFVFDPASPALPFDWAEDGHSVIAVQPVGAGRSRVDLFDARTGGLRRTDGVLPTATSFVSLDVATSRAAAPRVAATRPLLGTRTGIVIVMMRREGAVERLDLDTGAMSVVPTGGSPLAGVSPSGQDSSAVPGPTLAGGTILTSGYTTWWVPKHGPLRQLVPRTFVIPESSQRAWLAETFENGDATRIVLWPVDGSTGATGRSLRVYNLPSGAVNGEFIESLSPTLDHPASLDLWNPRTGARRDIPGVANGESILASGGEEILSSSGCPGNDGCRVTARNVRTGAARVLGDSVKQPPSLAPDGHAVVFSPAEGDQAGEAFLVDLVTGAQQSLLGATGGPVVWGPNGWVFYSNGNDLLAWRSGMTHALVVPDVSGAISTATAL